VTGRRALRAIFSLLFDPGARPQPCPRPSAFVQGVWGLADQARRSPEREGFSQPPAFRTALRSASSRFDLVALGGVCGERLYPLARLPRASRGRVFRPANCVRPPSAISAGGLQWTSSAPIDRLPPLSMTREQSLGAREGGGGGGGGGVGGTGLNGFRADLRVGRTTHRKVDDCDARTAAAAVIDLFLQPVRFCGLCRVARPAWSSGSCNALVVFRPRTSLINSSHAVQDR